ncbi:MAG: mercury methylation corrinoid protein HgcA [Spirochaetes bacterium]|nr:mercury methylation corrinoid protein HgcA [Spirochaetota bacterium]
MMRAKPLSDSWTWKDYWGAFKVRWGIGRSSYTMEPGLYALGTPTEEDLVFVTANYKLSVDHLRKALKGRNVWILVLDTKGINVWCAAGKGTFGTIELIQRIETTGLREKKGKKILILPQLGAPGVSAHEVERATGFRVIYGPIRAKDLPNFLDSGLKATEEMRQVTFSFTERIVLIPVELVGLIKPSLLLVSLLTFVGALLVLGSSTLHATPTSIGKSLWVSFRAFLPILPAAFLGVLLFPPLLPMLPGRAFSFKGAVLGLLGTGIYLIGAQILAGTPGHFSTFQGVPYLLLLAPIVSFLALNFTGSTPFTSLSGVLKETRIALPFQTGGFLVGTLWLWIDLFVNKGVL